MIWRWWLFPLIGPLLVVILTPIIAHPSKWFWIWNAVWVPLFTLILWKFNRRRS